MEPAVHHLGFLRFRRRRSVLQTALQPLSRRNCRVFYWLKVVLHVKTWCCDCPIKVGRCLFDFCRNSIRWSAPIKVRTRSFCHPKGWKHRSSSWAGAEAATSWATNDSFFLWIKTNQMLVSEHQGNLLEISWYHVFCCSLTTAPKINPCVIPNSLEDLGMFLYRNPPELCLLCVPEPSRTSSAICPATLQNLISFLVRNPPEPHRPSALEPSGTSSAICTGTVRNLISFLHRNPPEPHPPEPCLLSAPEPSETSSAICAGTRRNLPEPPEPSPEPGVAAAPDRTRAILS